MQLQKVVNKGAPIYFKIVGIDHKLYGLVIDSYHEKYIKYIAKS